ncbi:hypothetical protein E5206_09450 [Arthrobacter sp. PAMC25564]|uniref:hypothetical protein n=1 Tax=Arthrobacter sp. PAMC25564 TaxID=2565366 RepID=UPI0010A21576|nr:hypothetical protein [Arthrobacter sp. PAMC25564]QCB97129.1 hypothetical protein E5206_09450 [Arthrobacter sp. PAMC25564]
MDTPLGLGERGSAIWQAMATTDIPRNALVLEAARTADRLDELDNIIQGKGVLNLMQFRLDFPSGDDEPYIVEVKFAAPLAEARQQATALAGILSKLAPADTKAAPQAAPSNLPSNVSPLQRLMQQQKA